jgi:putative phosphoribosyl transferase
LILHNLIFKNRKEAFQMLYDVLPTGDMRQEHWIVLATSAGGVPIALEIAKKLNTDFDFLFTEKIYTRKNSKCEIAIITETQEVVIHEELMKSFSLKLEDIYQEANDIYLSDIKEYQLQYRHKKDLIELKDKNVLLVDEGLNTGLTMMACIKSVINKKAKSICVAVPVLPSVTINDIETIADDLYYVQAPDHFVSIDFYYEELETITLHDIQKLIENYTKEKDVNNM